METAVKRNLEWELIRYPLRQGYKQMQKALDEYMLRMIQKMLMIGIIDLKQMH